MPIRLPGGYSLCFALLIAFSTTVQGQTRQTDWKADLAYLAKEMPLRHKNLYHKVSEKDFSALVRKFEEEMPALSRNQIIMRIAELAAAVGDGHTNLAIARDKATGFHSLPLKLQLFSDGLYVRAASPENRDLVGQQVRAICDVPIKEVFDRILPIISGDNLTGRSYFLPVCAAISEVLNGLGIAKTDQSVALTLADGKRVN